MQIRPPKAKPTKPKRKGRARKGEGSLKLRGKTWWYIIPNPERGGRRIEKSCETSDYEEAMLAKNRALVELHGSRKRDRGMRPPAVTIHSVLDNYSSYCVKEK